MGQPITTKQGGICFAFPNVCKTPAPPGSPVPIPYSSIGQLSAARDTASKVLAGGAEVVTTKSKIDTTTGDAAGTVGGVTSGTFGKEVEFTKGSATVFAQGDPVVRMGDPTKQNHGNAAGSVLGGFARVLVGG
jgi:hypothetical protein